MPGGKEQANVEEIRKIAYLNWVNRGRPQGDPMTDWKAASEYVIHGNQQLLADTTRQALAKSNRKVNGKKRHRVAAV